MKTKKGALKGFVVSIDSVIAIFISVFFVSYVFSIVNSFASYESISYVKLQRIGEDSLRIMEMTNSFNSQSAINTVFQQTGDQICMMLEIYNQSFQPSSKTGIFVKPGCAPNTGQGNAEERSFRTFYSNGNFNYAVVSVWLKDQT
jgi:hypothetical protein